MRQFISDSSPFPVPLYFIGGFGEGSEAALQSLAAESYAGNITYLGHAGVVQVHGLTVAFLDGTYNKSAFNGLQPNASSLGCRHYTQVRSSICWPCPNPIPCGYGS